VDQVGEQRVEHGSDGADFDAAGRTAVSPLDGAADRFEPAGDRSGFVEQDCAGVGQLDATACAGEQCGAERLLKLLNLLAERRLRDPQSLRGAAEVELFGNGDEVLELLEGHWGLADLGRRTGGETRSASASRLTRWGALLRSTTLGVRRAYTYSRSRLMPGIGIG
jgi:hypothetical protein